MPRRRMDVKRQLRTTHHVVEALDGRVSFEDVDAVINALWWDKTTTVLPHDPDGHGPFGRRRIVDDGDLERVASVLEDVETHLVARDESNAALNMAPPRPGRLRSAVEREVARVRGMLDDPADEEPDHD